MKEKNTGLQMITFIKTSDPFQSAGLATLVDYLEDLKAPELSYAISGESVTISSPEVEKVLIAAYEHVCGEYFDISGQKAREESAGIYYDTIKGTFHRYPKVKQVGYAQLINNSRPMPRAEGKKMSIKVGGMEDSLRAKLFQFVIDEKMKVSDKDTIYIDDRNTAVPKMNELNIQPGQSTCIICGDKYAKTYETVKFSPFLGGKSAGLNYVSMTKNPEKACWKCVYLNRLSVGKFLYRSEIKGNKDQKLFCFSFYVDTLDGMIKVNNRFLPLNFVFDFLKKQSINFRTNFALFTDDLNIIRCQHFNETLLALLFTVYNKFKTMLPDTDEISWLREIEKVLTYNTSVFYIFARKFGDTVRPQTSGSYTELSYLFSLFGLTTPGGMVAMFHATVDYSVLDGNKQNLYEMALSDRDEWAKAVLSKQPTIGIVERLVCRNVNRSYNQAIDFLKIYESYIYYGGNMAMNDEIRDLAIKLGSQIGMYALQDKNPKAGKGKIIQLRKSRNLESYLDVLISLQTRYGVVLNRELLNQINEENFEYVRQFSIIQAMNIVNSKAKSDKKEENQP